MFNFSICFLKNSIKAALVHGLLAQKVKRKSKKYSIYSMSAFQKVPRNDILRNSKKCLHPPPHPSLRDTFSPREEAF